MSTSQHVAQHVDPNDTYVTQLYVLCILFPVLATLSVALRFLSRRLDKTDLWWDDWTALLALAWIWATFAMAMKAIQYGKGRHIVFLSDDQKTAVRYWSYWFALWYTAIPPTVKVSALLLYRRIFISDAFNKLVAGMLALVSVWGVAMTLISALGCHPVSAFWTGHGVCVDEHKWVLGYGIPNIIFDVIVWAMPIPRVWLLNLPRHHKLTLTMIFSLGLTDCVLAIIRLAGSAESLGDPDTSYSWAPAMWWSLIHTSLGVVVISLPTMRILLIKARQRFIALRVDSEISRNDSLPTTMTRRSKGAMFRAERDIGFSLCGDDDDKILHNNAIAMALHPSLMTDAVPRKGIQVRQDFVLDDGRSERSRSDSDAVSRVECK